MFLLSSSGTFIPFVLLSVHTETSGVSRSDQATRTGQWCAGKTDLCEKINVIRIDGRSYRNLVTNTAQSLSCSQTSNLSGIPAVPSLLEDENARGRLV